MRARRRLLYGGRDRRAVGRGDVRGADGGVVALDELLQRRERTRVALARRVMRDVQHLDLVLGNLRRVPAVANAQRVVSGNV